MHDTFRLYECPVCGGEVHVVREAHPIRIGQRTIDLEVEHEKCAKCGETFFAPDQMDAIQRRAADTVRREEGLLFPEDIRQIREDLGLTQAKFERLLGVGPKTVVRWERGTVFQNCATDALLRVLANVPEAVDFLIRHRAAEAGLGSFEMATQPPLSGPEVERTYFYTASFEVYEDVSSGNLVPTPTLSFNAQATDSACPEGPIG